jgi:hypothetical protein
MIKYLKKKSKNISLRNKKPAPIVKNKGIKSNLRALPVTSITKRRPYAFIKVL